MKISGRFHSSVSTIRIRNAHPQRIDPIDTDEGVPIGKQLKCVIRNPQSNTDTAPIFADCARQFMLKCLLKLLMFSRIFYKMQ